MEEKVIVVGETGHHEYDPHDDARAGITGTVGPVVSGRNASYLDVQDGGQNYNVNAIRAERDYIYARNIDLELDLAEHRSFVDKLVKILGPLPLHDLANEANNMSDDLRLCCEQNAELIVALADCVSVMEQNLAGLIIIQPELKQARAALDKAALTNYSNNEGMQEMTDRELLELAAKACGYEYTNEGYARSSLGDGHYKNFPFDPRVSDGDSRRLQLSLGMSLDFDMEHDDGACWVACAGDAAAAEYLINHHGDSKIAARMAVLRCAARVGEWMP